MLNKNIIIRVNGNANIGLGHIYRGIALAEMLKDEFEIEFICNKDTTVSPIHDANFKYVFLPEDISLLEEPCWFKKQYPIDTIIILDGYNFNENYQQKIKEYNYKLVYIDDLAKGVQKADLVINHSPSAKKSMYTAESYTTLALGLDYAILRPSFINEPQQIKINKGAIFVCFGGADTNDLTLNISKLLLNIKQITQINIVIGEAYKNNEIFTLQNVNNRIKIYRNLSEVEIYRVMFSSGYAIAPASTILFELLSLEKPVLSGYYVDNQKEFYKYLFDNDIVYGIGDLNRLDENNFKDLLYQMLNKKKDNKQIIDRMQKQRIVNKIKSL